jgi:UDP-N-acetylmuramoyl-tripeptide--D-alanyl-D-alanine ligase
VHTENFADGEAGVARAKAEIFEGLKRGGTAVLNADGVWFDFLAGEREASARGCELRRGRGRRRPAADCDGRARPRGRTPACTGRPIDFTLLQTGRHWGPNSLAVLLVLEAMEVPLETALGALAAFEPLAGRGAERVTAAASGWWTKATTPIRCPCARR